MKKLIRTQRSYVFSAIVLAIIAISTAHAETSAFTYQGYLTSGSTPANGNFDLSFKLYDAITGGTQVGSTVTVPTVAVNNGLFSVSLDFGAAAFPGADRFLELTFTPSGGGTATTMSRNQIYSAPYATTAAALTVPSTTSGSDSTAAVSITNSAPGISNPTESNLPPAGLRVEATSTSGSNAGIIGIADGDNSFGVLGFANGTPAPCSPTPCDGPEVNGVLGSAGSTTGKTRGVHGEVFSPGGVGVYAQNNATLGDIYEGWNDTGMVFEVTHTGNVIANKFNLFNGDFFVNATGNMVANTVDTNEVFSNNIAADSGNTVSILGDLSVNGNLGVSGSKGAMTKLSDGRSVLVCAVEAPENWFEDFGSGELKNGVAWVPLDKTFAETVNPELEYHVFVTPGGDCRGLYVAKRTPNGFEVRELGQGRSSTGFDYRIVARRRGFEKQRFAEAPEPPVTKAKPAKVR